jgi:hypothetical protein
MEAIKALLATIKLPVPSPATPIPQTRQPDGSVEQKPLTHDSIKASLADRLIGRH